MPSMKRSQLLARVNFPVYSVQCFNERYVLVAGGGGGAKTGIRNAIEIYELINDGSTCRAEPVTHFETGNEAIMNSAIHNFGKYCLLFAGKEGNCQVYKIKHAVVDEETVTCENKSDESPKTVRKRLNSGTTSNSTNATTSDAKKPDQNANVHPSKLHFNIRPLDSFQTDFHEEPFQKLVRFSGLKNTLVTGGADGHIRVWKHPNLNKVFEIKAHTDDVDDLDICPSGKRIVSVSRDGYGKVWSTEDGSLITDLQRVIPSTKSDERYIFRSCRFGIVEDKNDLALFTTLNPAIRKKPLLKSYICKFETKTFSVDKFVSTGTDMLSAMAISNDGRFIGLGCQSGTVKMYIAFSLQMLYNVENIHGIFVTCVQFLPTSEESRRITGGHESSLISVSVDNRIIIHHIPMRPSMRFLTLVMLLILTLFLVFVIMDFFNL